MPEISRIYNKLFDFFGAQDWWPGDSPFEVMVGAILTQNTNWSNVEKAISNLKKKNILSAKAIYKTSPLYLSELIRPAGYFKVKTKHIRNYLKFFLENYNGNEKKMMAYDIDVLRPQILSVNGIGKETADSILLYALDKPIFVVDAYTKRILIQHNLISEEAEYDEVQAYFMDNLPLDAKLYNEYHALIVKCAKLYCKSKNPKCDECPLQDVNKKI